VVYLLLELQQETGYVLHHAQKLLAVLAGMRDFARQLKAAGHRVRYVAIDDPSNRGSWRTIWTRCASTIRPRIFLAGTRRMAAGPAIAALGQPAKHSLPDGGQRALLHHAP
jgi:hypothetical protein